MKLIKLTVMFAMILASLCFVFAEITYTDSATSSTYFNQGGAPMCVISGELSSWTYANGTVINIREQGQCYKENGISATGIDYPNCCPLEYNCNISSGLCMHQALPLPLDCGNYTTNTTCIGVPADRIANTIYGMFIASLQEQGIDDEFIPEIGSLSFCTSDIYKYENEDTCMLLGSCGCTWNGTKCLNYYKAINCTDADNPDELVDEYLCEKTNPNELENKCNEDDKIYLLSWYAQLSKNGVITSEQQEWCSSGSKEFPCPEVSAIPFFTAFNMLLCVIGIMFIYLILRKE